MHRREMSDPGAVRARGDGRRISLWRELQHVEHADAWRDKNVVDCPRELPKHGR